MTRSFRNKGTFTEEIGWTPDFSDLDAAWLRAVIVAPGCGKRFSISDGQ
jgi:hypothetical protein